MTLRLYLFGLVSATLISFGLGTLLILGVNPYQAPNWIILVFYLSLVVFLTSVLAITVFYLKVRLSNREVIFSHLFPTLRQSFFISLIITACIFLYQIKIFNWWAVLLLFIAIGLIEMFFRTKKQ